METRILAKFNQSGKDRTIPFQIEFRDESFWFNMPHISSEIFLGYRYDTKLNNFALEVSRMLKVDLEYVFQSISDEFVQQIRRALEGLKEQTQLDTFEENLVNIFKPITHKFTKEIY